MIPSLKKWLIFILIFMLKFNVYQLQDITKIYKDKFFILRELSNYKRKNI